MDESEYNIRELVRERNIRLQELIKNKKFLHIAAPMFNNNNNNGPERYKLPFRLLCRQYNVDLAYTPMISSEEFIRSPETRINEFTINKDDSPLVVQFAANSPVVLAKAAEYVKDYCYGIDINCGCPQRWAIRRGYGAALLNNPELIKEMIKMTKEATGIPCSIKIRLDHRDIRNTIELSRIAEKVGVSWITVHARNFRQASTEPVDFEAVKIIKEDINIPVFANGQCSNMKDIELWKKMTKVDGIMAARGLLKNPALFAGYEKTPLECVNKFVNIALNVGITRKRFQNHLLMMLYDVLDKKERANLHMCNSFPAILEFLSERNFEFN